MTEAADKINTQLSLGSKLKEKRSSRKLTLDALSNLAGVSKAMLSQIEQDKVNPTIGVLMKISTALNTTISSLLDEPARKNIMRIIRHDDEQYTYRSDKNCRVRTLSPLSLEKNIEFYSVTLEAGGKLTSEPHYPGTEEILNVTRGKLEVTSGQQNATLAKGDSIHFRADVEHTIENPGKSTAEFFMVVRYKDL